MSLRSRLRLKWVLLVVLSFNCARAQSAGSVTGFVHDGSGVALADVALTLSGSGPPVVSRHIKTDKLGTFHFEQLSFGSYRLSSDAGDAIAPNGSIAVSAAMPMLRLDLTLIKAAKAPGLQLQAAGIRGYIDQGGYSAPAGAAAASNLIQGAADLNRSHGGADDVAAACSREPVLLKASRDRPDDAVAQRQLGQFYVARHRPEEAVAALRRARALDGRDAQTLLALAEAFVQSKQFAAARDLLATDATVANTAAGHRLLARADEGLEEFKQASMEYQAAAALVPTDADFYGVGYELILAGSAKAAMQAFEAGTERYPASVTLLMGVGTAQFLQGQSAEATQTFLRCATLHPGDARIYPFLSASFVISRVEAEAVGASFRRYEELAPQSAEAAYFYALILLHRSTASMPEDGVDAEGLLQRAVQLRPDFAKAHLQLGNVYFDRKENARAAQEYSAALRLDPSFWETRYKLSVTYRRMEETSLADQQMRIFLARKSQNAVEDQTGEVHIEQFLSVFAGQNEGSTAEAPCAAQR